MMASLLRHPASPRVLRALARNEPRLPSLRIQPFNHPHPPRTPRLFPARQLHTSLARPSAARKDVPNQAPPTDFDQLNVLGNTPVPSTAVDVCMADGFQLNSGARVLDGNGVILVGGEAFVWRPWLAKEVPLMLVNAKGQWDVPAEAFGLLALVWPRPDLLILGIGPQMLPVSPETKRAISELGMRVEVLDTRNAAAQFNLLATERGVHDVAAALIPIGWKDGEGAL